MSLPQWALDAGADPEIGWECVRDARFIQVSIAGMFGDNHHFEVEQDLEFDSSSGPIDTWWLWLSVEKDSNLLNFAFPSPAHAIKAAEGLIRALRGDE